MGDEQSLLFKDTNIETRYLKDESAGLLNCFQSLLHISTYERTSVIHTLIKVK